MNLARATRSLAFLTTFARRFTKLTPFGALLSPMLGAVAELIADAIRAFFNGLAIVFRNPTVLLVVFAAMGYGYFNGYGTSKAEVAKLTAEVAQLRKIKRCAAPAVRTKSPPSMWDSIFN